LDWEFKTQHLPSTSLRMENSKMKMGM
jgi:hypothetical protein